MIFEGKKIFFKRTLKVTQVNIVDALSATAVMLMGESDEQTPLLIGRGLNFIKFTNKNKYNDLIIDRNEDMYYPILKNFKKMKNEFKTQILFALFIGLLVGMNLLGGKIISLFSISVSVGIFMVPLTFLITDIIAEVHGKKMVKNFIFSGIIVLIIIFLYTILFVKLNAHSRYSFNDEYVAIFSNSLRMLFV